MSNISNPAAYLRTTRNFPTDIQPLTVEISKAYLDIANVVNARTIGVFATIPSVTGNTWYLAGASQRNQTLRQVFQFTSAGSITHNINTSNIAGFVAIYGTFTDGSVWYPLPYVSTTAANQVSVTVTSTSIVITAGGGAPAITRGFVVLEWLSQI